MALTFFMLSGLTGLAAQAGLELPPIPEDFGFLQDYAGILDSETRIEVGVVQREVFEQHQTAIVVVTIPHMGEYRGWSHFFEDFAREWLDHWEIGCTGPGGGLRTRGSCFS